MFNLIYEKPSTPFIIMIIIHSIDANGSIEISIQYKNLDNSVKLQFINKLLEHHLPSDVFKKSPTVPTKYSNKKNSLFVFDDELQKIIKITSEFQFIPTNNYAQTILPNIIQISQKLRRQVRIEKPDTGKLTKLDANGSKNPHPSLVTAYLKQVFERKETDPDSDSGPLGWITYLKNTFEGKEIIFQDYLESIQKLPLVDFIWLCEEETDIFSFLANKHSLYEKYYRQYFKNCDEKSPILTWREALMGRYYLQLAQNAYQIKCYLETENKSFQFNEESKSFYFMESCIYFYSIRRNNYLQKSAKKYCFHALEATIFSIFDHMRQEKEAAKQESANFKSLMSLFSETPTQHVLQNQDVKPEIHGEPDDSECNESSEHSDFNEVDIKITESENLLAVTCITIIQKYGSAGYFRLAQFYHELSILFEKSLERKVLYLQKALSNYKKAKKSYHLTAQLPLSCYLTENMKGAFDDIMHNKIVSFTVTEYQELLSNFIDSTAKLLVEALIEQRKSQDLLQVLPTISMITPHLLWADNSSTIHSANKKRGPMELSDLVNTLTQTIQDRENDLSVEAREKIQKVKKELDELKKDILSNKRVKP